MASNCNPVILITGAQTGLGLAIVKALCQSSTPYQIVIGTLNVQEAEDAISNLKTEFPNTSSTLSLVHVDLTSDDSIQKAADHLSSQHGRVDALVNNGGATFDAEIRAGRMTTREAWNKTFDVNIAGTQVMTERFVPLLLKSRDPRLLFLTSGTACLTETEYVSSPDNPYNNPMLESLNAAPEAGWPKAPNDRAYPAYRTCKTGLNMMMREWSRVLRNDGVKVWSISPGYLATGIFGKGVSEEEMRKSGAKDPSVGGEFIRDVIEGKRDSEQGKAIRVTMVQPW